MRAVRQLPIALSSAIGMQLIAFIFMSLACVGCAGPVVLPDSKTLDFFADVQCRQGDLVIISTVTNKTKHAVRVKDADLPWAKNGPGLYWLTTVDDLGSIVQQQRGLRSPVSMVFVLSAGSSLSEVAKFYDVFDSHSIKKGANYFFNASYRTPADHKASSLGFMTIPCAGKENHGRTPISQ